MGDHLRNSALPHALTDVIDDVADLLRKEIRLAQTEIAGKLSAKLRAGAWMVVMAVAALIVLLLVVEGVVFAIAAYGVAMHWSCLIVAAVMAIIAGIAFAVGKADAEESVTPSRSIHNLKQDFSATKEQLT